MKGLNILASIVAIAAMSFTIVSHSQVFEKRTNITNCYKVMTTANYLNSCANPPIFTDIDCFNKLAAIDRAVKNDLALSSFTTFTVSCAGGSVLCCINLRSSVDDPCLLATSLEQRGNGSLKDFNGFVIFPSEFVIVNDIECKN